MRFEIFFKSGKSGKFEEEMLLDFKFQEFLAGNS